MTADECRQLWERWERLAQSRQASVWDQPGSGCGATADTPDLGWRFARWMAGEGPPAPSPLHALIGRGVYANIRYAVEDRLKGKPPGRCGVGVGHVREAGMLNGCPHRGPLLKAALFALDATIGSVADALDLAPGVVKAFNDLHFNVAERRDEVAYRRSVVGAIRSMPLMFPEYQKGGPNLATMIECAENGTLEEVLAENAIGRDAMSEEGILRIARKRMLRGVDKLSATMASGQFSSASAAPIFKLMEELRDGDAAAAQYGPLNDPFLELMMQDSKDYNEDFRRREEAAAMKRAKGGADEGHPPRSAS